LAKGRYNYLFSKSTVHRNFTKNEYTGVTVDKTTSNYLDEFMTHALTNENFSNFLKGINLKEASYKNSSWSGIRGNNIQDTLLNLFRFLIDVVTTRILKPGNTNALAEATELAVKLANIQSKFKTKRFETLKKYGGIPKKLYDKGDDLVKASFHKVLPKAEMWKDGFDQLMDDPSKGGQLFREVFNKVASMDQGIVKTTVQEAKGMTTRLADYYQLLARRKRVLDSAKESISNAFTLTAEKSFKKPLNSKQKITMTKASLKPDVSVLLDSLGEKNLKAVYKDKTKRELEINKILDTLADKTQFPNTAKYTNFYDRSAMTLGDFIVHAQMREGENSNLNAQLISELAGTREAGNLSEEDSKKVEPLIDQLTSLYAIGSLSESVRADFGAIMEEDIEGVIKTLKLHRMLKEQAAETSFKGAERLIIKGYTKAILNSEVQFKFGVLEDEAEMKQAGYTRQVTAVKRDNVDPYNDQQIFMYTARTGRLNNLAAGILSYARNKAKGVSSKTLAEQTDTLSAEGKRNTEKIKLRKQQQLDSMFTKKRNPKAKLSNNLIPKSDQAGNIIDYRYMMSEAVKDSYLDQVNDYDVLLGSMASQIVEKKVTPTINKELIQRLKQTYDDEYQKNPDKFVQIGPNVSDPDMIEQYYMIPDKTRRVIPAIWGGHGTMYVPKDLMSLAFGYRKYSLVDAFTKKPSERAVVEKLIIALTNSLVRDTDGKEGRGLKAINSIEQVASEITHYAKDNIIVKSLSVTLNNFGSNLVYLRMKGVPMTYIARVGMEAIKQGTRYQADILKANLLDIEKIQLKKEDTVKAKQRLKVVNKELMQVKDSLNRNPVSDSIASGLMPSLVDDIDTQGQQNYFPGRVEKLVNTATNKLPKTLKTAGKVLFMSQDTNTYKVLNNAVKLTDFVGRHVLYNYYIKMEGLNQKEAAQKAIEEFINFDIPSHRITEYLNEVGLLWFTKYATRIPMVAFKAIKDKPLTASMAYLTGTHLGLDNIIDSAIPNLGYKIDTPITAWAGSADELLTSQLIGKLLP